MQQQKGQRYLVFIAIAFVLSFGATFPPGGSLELLLSNLSVFLQVHIKQISTTVNFNPRSKSIYFS